MPFKLAVRFSGKLIETLEFEEEERINIGRAPDCDVVIDNLGVSRIHAQIERLEDVYVLRDMNSNNGTYIRGDKVQRYNLNSGDEFFLGKHSVTFTIEVPESNEYGWLDEPEAPVAEAPVEDPANIQDMTISMDASNIALKQVKANQSLSAYLSYIGASGVRQKLPIVKTATFFGSHPQCDHRLEGWFMNKRHVLLLKEEKGFRVIHLANKKPPKVNGVEVDDYKLKHGDLIEVEELRLTFNIGT